MSLPEKADPRTQLPVFFTFLPPRLLYYLRWSQKLRLSGDLITIWKNTTYATDTY